MNAQKLRALANHDQLIASVLSIWNATDPDMQDEFISWLEDSNPETVRRFLNECPDQWLAFIQLCAITGLLQSVLVTSC